MLTMQAPTLRTVLAAAVPVGVVVSAAVVWQSTSAAFTATTDNPGNSWQSGTVDLSDSDKGSALFTTAGDSALVPGSTRFRCIQVDYTGTVDADIRLYVTTPPPTPQSLAKSLDPYLTMTVERGADVTDGSTLPADCEGFGASTALFTDTPRTMAQLKAHGNYADGLRVGTVRPGTHLTFKITYLVEGDNDAQGAESRATFVWEAHNTGA